MLEFGFIVMKVICDRGVTHEIVRHRLFSFAQESTRYVGYSDKLKPDENMTEDDVLNNYELGLTMKKISELSKGKYKEWDIYKILDKNDIKRRNHGRRGLFNETFFEVIDTAEKAYLLGIIQADGNLRKDSPNINITQKNGWYIERLLKDFIQPDIKATKDKDCNRYSFTSEKMYSDLYSKGIVPNKSYDMTTDNANNLWNSIPDNLKWDFLRGLLDGDGCIRFFKQKNKGETNSCNITWNGNLPLMAIISLWLEKMFEYKTNVLAVGGTDNLWRLSITKPDIGDKVCDFMYKNFVFPYGNPVKTSRAYEHAPFDFKFATWGDERFKVILPPFFVLNQKLWLWSESMTHSEESYTNLMNLGATPQEARSVLPNSLKTEIVIGGNIREWMHFTNLRSIGTTGAPHPQMKEVADMIYEIFKKELPEIFENIGNLV